MTTNNELLNKLEGEVLEMGRRARDRDMDRRRDFDKSTNLHHYYTEDDVDAAGCSEDLYGNTDLDSSAE